MALQIIFNPFVGEFQFVGSTGTTPAITVLTATGTMNDSNTQFTFIQKPTLINVNGTFYRENNGWSWTAGTLTATLDSPVGTGGDIYGLL